MSDEDFTASGKASITRGETRTLSYHPYYYEGWKITGLTGSYKTKGRSVVIKLPFDIYLDPDLTKEFKTTDLVTGRSIIIYPPFASFPSSTESTKLINTNYIPYISGRLPPNHDKAGFNDFSLTSMSGIACDCIRLDIFNNVAEDDDPIVAEVVSDIVNRLLKILRWYTGQWWITKDRGPLMSNEKYQFDINEYSERISPFHAVARTCGLLGTEKNLNGRRLNGSCYSLSINRQPPMYIELLFDSIFFYYDDNIRHSIIEAAIACETLINSSLEAAIKNNLISRSRKNKLVPNNNKLIQNFDRACESMGYNFNSEDNKDNFRKIENLWVARGNIAHGTNPIIQIDGPKNIRDVNKKDVLEMITALSEMISWAEEIFSLNPE